MTKRFNVTGTCIPGRHYMANISKKFIRPIINGKGFDFKEVQISEEKRLDIVITFQKEKHIIEFKVWHGESYHQAGLEQLCDYLDRQILVSKRY